MGKLVVGIDLGINNVGWSVLRRDDEVVEVLASGAFVFDSPLSDENKPSEGLKSRVRGQLRRARRTTRRRHQRKMELYRLLAEHGMLPRAMNERVELFCRTKCPETGQAIHPYALRAEATTRALEPYELGRALCHLNQRRGFLSPRDLLLLGVAKLDDVDDEAEDEETKGLKKEIQRTKEAMEDFSTLGEFLNERLKNGLPVRKTQLKKKNRTVPTKPEQNAEAERRFVRSDRHMIEAEFNAIMDAQQPHHPLLTDALRSRIYDIVFKQRMLSADASTRGRCTFFPDELRVPRAGLTAQKFAIAQEVAHLTVQTGPNAESRALNPEERRNLVEKLMNADALTWLEVKTLLELPTTARFNIEPEAGKRKSSAKGTKEELRGSQSAARIRAVLGEKWDQIGAQAQRDLVGEIVSIRDWTKEASRHAMPAASRRRQLFMKKAYGPNAVTFTEREANQLATVPLPEGYLNISLKAVKRIMPGLLRDRRYDQACADAKLDHADPQGPNTVLDRLPYPTETDIRHPIVLASVRGAVRILNAIHREFGKPDAIHIELPRDLAASADQREEESKRQFEREKERVAIAKELIALRYRPNRENIRKVRLWRELGGAGLPYEPHIVIPDLRSLLSGDYEVDHIVPRSHNLDDGLGNVTLCTREFNTQVKGNRTIWEALGKTDEARWNAIQTHVKSIKSMPLHKRNRILAKERPEDFTGRHLSATGYISKKVLELAQQMVERKEQVIVAPGRATGFLRGFWELDDLVPLHPVEAEERRIWKEFNEAVERGEAKPDDMPKQSAAKTRSNFKHHALDAIVVALADRASLKAVTDFFQLGETSSERMRDKSHRRMEKLRTLPDPNLRDKVSAALESAAIVRRPSRRPKGELHKMGPKEKVPRNMPDAAPWSSAVVGGYLVKYDQNGKAAQAYPLGNNHHVVIWERLQPNAKGEYERAAEVVPTIEAVRRQNKREPVIRKNRPEPGWRYVMSLCKGDMVEMEDGTVAVVSMLSPKQRPGIANIHLWNVYVARQVGEVNVQNPYLVQNIQTAKALQDIVCRVVMNPLGKIVYREGARE